MSHLSWILAFSINFCHILKVTCLVTLFDHKLQVFKISSKWTIFGIFNELLSTQNVNVARFARNVEWDFFCDFKHCALLLNMSTYQIVSMSCKRKVSKFYHFSYPSKIRSKGDHSSPKSPATMRAKRAMLFTTLHYSKCHIWILTFSTNFCPIKTDLSGNTDWP